MTRTEEQKLEQRRDRNLERAFTAEDRSILTEQETLFVDKYLRHFKPELAMMEAGYADYSALAVRGVMTTKRVKQAIANRLEMYTMSKEEVLYRLTEQGRNTYADYIDEYGNINLRKLIADGKAHLIQSVTPTRYGNKITFMDGQKAIELLGRYYQLFSGGESTGEVTVRVVFEENLLLDRNDSPDDYVDGVLA